MILRELAIEAGFRPGVINILYGSKDTVNFILDHLEIKAISFVGGNVARECIYERASGNGKRCQANLGAKNHAVLVPDCNKEQTLNTITSAAFGAAGQRCMVLSTLVCVGETKNWLPELVQKAKMLKVDRGFEDVNVGPVITKASKERVESLIDSADAQSATISLGGRAQKPENYIEGNSVSFILLPPLPQRSLAATEAGWSYGDNKCETTHDMLPRGDLRNRACVPWSWHSRRSN